MLESLKRKKAVVTANKMLIAEHLDEISRLLKQNPGAQFAYEAAVCGGIPIIHVFKTCYAGDVIHEVMVSNNEQHYRYCCAFSTFKFNISFIVLIG